MREKCLAAGENPDAFLFEISRRKDLRDTGEGEKKGGLFLHFSL